jgi:membrane associated rhomboid family serine protease
MFDPSPSGRPPERQPIFNLPTVIVGVLVVILGIQAIMSFALSTYTKDLIIWDFGFVPKGLTAPQTLPPIVLTGAARIWTFLTYALLHGGWEHVGFNALWLAAFGSPLAWRFGTTRFLLFSAVGAIAGALAHLAIFPYDPRPLVGASAAISAHMAGAARFVFASGGPMWRPASTAAYRMPAPPLATVMRDSRVLIFLWAWFGLNLLFGISTISQGIASGAIAWDAHIGGFVAGLLLFPLFDPVRAARP